MNEPNDASCNDESSNESRKELEYKAMTSDAENKAWKAHPSTESILDKIEQIHMLEREMCAARERIKRLEKDLVDLEKDNTRLSGELTIATDKIRELKDRLKYYGHLQL